jgi:hypothetical protein
MKSLNDMCLPSPIARGRYILTETRGFVDENGVLLFQSPLLPWSGVALSALLSAEREFSTRFCANAPQRLERIPIVSGPLVVGL